MDKDIAGINGPRRVTYMRLRELSVAFCCFEPRQLPHLYLMPISLWFHWSVRVSFDVIAVSEHIRNSQVKTMTKLQGA